jgi:lipopolysaccharide assembly protein A
MRVLTLAFYVLVGALLAWFAARNWEFVTLRLWGDFELIIRLPVLIFASFLIGVLPLGVLQNVSRWRLGRKVRRLEKALADTPTNAPPTAAAPTPPPFGP